MIDYASPIQPGKPIVIGQASILWGDSFTHPERGHVDGGWILPGCIRTTNAEHASRVCREINESIKAMKRAKPKQLPVTLPTEPEDIGAMIAQRFKDI